MTELASSAKKGSAYKAAFVFAGLFIGLSICFFSFLNISSSLILGIIFGICIGYSIFMLTLDNLNEYRKAPIKAIKEAFLINLLLGIFIGTFIYGATKLVLESSAEASRIFIPTFFVCTLGTVVMAWYFLGPDTEIKPDDNPN